MDDFCHYKLNNHMSILFKKQFTLCILVFSYLIIQAQKTEYIRHQINWQPISVDATELKLADNAVYNDRLPAVNLYYDTRPYNRAVFTSAKLIVDKSETISVNTELNQKITNTDFTFSTDLIELRKKYTINTTVFPIRRTADGQIEKLISFTIELTVTDAPALIGRNPESTFNSVLANGDIYKISVEKTGIYKIDKSFLESKLGIDVSKLNPKKLKIFGNRGGRLPEANSASRTDDLQELAIFVTGEGDGKWDNGDFALFYAEGADVWRFLPASNSFSFDKNIYDTNNYYFIKIDNQDGLRIQKSTAVADIPDLELSNYDMLQRLEDDKTNLLGSYTAAEGTGKEWYGDIFNSSAKEKLLTSRFDFSGFNPSAHVEAEMVFAGRSKSNSTVSLSIGSKTINKIISPVSVLNAESTYANKTFLKESFTINDANPVVKLSYTGTSSDAEGWVDFVQIVHSRLLAPGNTQTSFRSRASKSAGTASFIIKDYSSQTIWDITNPYTPVEMMVSDGQMKFKPANTVREFMSHNIISGAPDPVALGKIPNQNLHVMNNEQMIIVYHPSFKADAQRLAEHRSSKSGFKVLAAETTQIYNEFSSGKADPVAIRDMAKLLLERNPDFKYLLLFGDGTYDYKGLVKDIPAENFVPAYETDESLDPIDGFPSDDFYGLLGDNEGVNLKGALDIYVGRLPAKTSDEAKILVDKIIHYDNNEESLGDWRLRSGYVADDEDFNTHLRDIDDIARQDEVRHPLYNQQKVYSDAFKQVSTPGENRYPDANRSINDNIFKGQLTLTYLGHGGPLGWAQERILTVPDIQSWTNINSLTVMVTATCSFGAYDDPAVVSPAEYALLSPKGGAIGMMTTTRAVYTNSNKQLTDAAHELMFKNKNGKAPTLGYILGEGKNKYTGESFRVNSRKFSLLGDPSLHIALPKLQVVTTKINNKDASSVADTINALEKVTIEGYISNENNEIATGFNGTIYPTVYDKKSTLQTLSNDADSPKFNYTLYKNIIFKGAATVTAGKWSFSFWVPKNINYSYGKGRISYYATDQKTTDAAGVFTNFIIGGTTTNLIADDQGPQIDIFMNDESFVPGGVTNANPVLLLNLSDDFGINVTGNAIGQDITAILDGDNQNVYILNDFYEAQKDNYTNGKVKFPLSKLQKGTHYITAKAWDISGNSAEKRVDFTVAEDNDAGLRHVYNYPNPFTTNTTFQFEHDLANTELDVLINIYTITGKLIKSITQTKYSTGFRVNDIGWNGRDDFESGLARGIYLYKIVVHSKELNLKRESGFEKLIKL